MMMFQQQKPMNSTYECFLCSSYLEFPVRIRVSNLCWWADSGPVAVNCPVETAVPYFEPTESVIGLRRVTLLMKEAKLPESTSLLQK